MSKATQFKRNPEGAKTSKMLEVEERIGMTLEADYTANYLSGHLGQKRLANRWGVARNQIFGKLRGGRRNWVQMLGLPLRGEASSARTVKSSEHSCEICGATNVPLEAAHWVPARDGGSSRKENILRLCPNCHTRLDLLEDQVTTKRAREVLLLRAADTLLQSTSARDENMQRRFHELCVSIIERKRREA